MKYLFFLFWVFLFFLSGCSGKTHRNHFPDLKKSEIITIHCINAPMEDYSLYLPARYNPSVRWPVLIFFDSHGKGRYPLSLYKSISEKYGIILAGSNIIKNGMEINDVIAVYLDLLFDLKKRISADTGLIFLSGFSGGARVASILAYAQPGTSGVIACSAGMDPAMLKYKLPYPYVCIAGITDMNYSELVSLNEKLELTGIPHQLLVFEGKHEWPPCSVMDEACLFLLLSNRKKNVSLKTDSVVSTAITYFSKKNDSARKTNPYSWFRTAEQTVNYLEGFTDVVTEKKIADSLKNTIEVKNAIKHEQDLLALENIYKSKLIKSIHTETSEWWKKQVLSINDKIAHASGPDAFMYKRVLGYISLASYSNISYALKAGKLDDVKNFLDIYSLVDPDNPDCAYFKACYYARQHDHFNTITYLNDAISKGFSDCDKIKEEPSFSHLQYDSDFQKAVKRIR